MVESGNQIYLLMFLFLIFFSLFILLTFLSGSYNIDNVFLKIDFKNAFNFLELFFKKSKLNLYLLM